MSRPSIDTPSPVEPRWRSSAAGLFARDARHLSRLELTIDVVGPGGEVLARTWAKAGLAVAELVFRTVMGDEALRADPHLANGLNVHEGQITNAAVAKELGYQHVPVAAVLQ